MSSRRFPEILKVCDVDDVGLKLYFQISVEKGVKSVFFVSLRIDFLDLPKKMTLYFNHLHTYSLSPSFSLIET